MAETKNNKKVVKAKNNIDSVIANDIGDKSDDGLVFVDINNDYKNDTKEELVSKKNKEVVSDIEEESTFGGDVLELLKYCLMIAIVMIFGEIIMSQQLGGISASSMFSLFFIPAEAMFFAVLCGIGNNTSSRITFPIIVLIPIGFYIAQTIYLMTFGSLLSVSFLGMGNDVVGNFGWTMADVLKKAIPYILMIIAPVVLAIIIAASDVFSLKKYRFSVHLIGIVLVVVLWFGGILGIKSFGTDRTSPYMLFTNASATTDTVAKKLGVMTTSIVESGSYFFGIGINEGGGFVEEFDDYDLGEGTESIVKIEDGTDDVQQADEVEEVVSVPWENEAIDFARLASTSDDAEFASLAGYFASRHPSTTNEYTGMFEGYNLIYICAESFWSYACNEKVTPTLYKMAHNGIVLNNYYNSFNNTTTNGEFAFDTSLWPDVSRFSKNGTDIGSFAQSSTKFMPQGLGDLFSAQGIPSYAFHNYYGKYYRRILSWPNLGYKCRFTGDGMWFTSNWPASDLELMQQTVDDYINDDQFHAYYMTFSGHGPYTAKNYMYNKNIGEVNALTQSESYNDMARGYLAGELELDRAMEYLLTRLEEAGKLDKTVIVLTSDHYPYYLDAEARDSLVGYSMDEEFEIYKSTCIMYNAGMDEPLEVNDYCCNIDIAPTVLNLFNIPFESRLMIGRDIFSKESHRRAVLYNKSFISDKVRYNYETGEAQWTDLGNQMSEVHKKTYLDSQLSSIENEYMASCKAIDDNFFLKVYQQSGLLTAQEVSDEIAREQMAQSQDDTFNLEDEEAAAAKAAEQAAREAEAAAAAEAEMLQNQLNELLMLQAGEGTETGDGVQGDDLGGEAVVIPADGVGEPPGTVAGPAEPILDIINTQ